MLKRCSKKIALIHLTMFIATLPISVWAAQSQKPILEMIPQEASAFVVLSDLDQADKAIATLGNKTQLPIPGPIMILRMGTDLGDIIDAEGSLAALFFAQKPDPEKRISGEKIESFATASVFLFNVSDFSKLLATFNDAEKVDGDIYKVKVSGSEMFLTSKDGYALLATKESRKSLDLVLASKTGMTETLRPWKDWVDKQVVYGLLTHDGIKAFQLQKILNTTQKNNSEDDDIFHEDNETDVAPTAIQAKDTATAPAEAETQQNQLLDDVSLAAVGVSVDDSGIVRVTTRLDIKPNSELSKAVGNTKPLSYNPLVSFSSNPFVLAGGGPFPDGLIHYFQTLQKNPVDSNNANTNSGLTLRLLPHDNFHASLRGLSIFYGSPQGEQTQIENIQTLNWTEDAEQTFEAIKKDQKKVQACLESFIQNIVSVTSFDLEEETDQESKKEKDASLTNVSIKETTIENCKALVVTYDLSKALEKLNEGPLGNQMSVYFERAYGKGFKVNEYNIQLDKNRILTTYCNDTEKLKEYINLAKNQAGKITNEEGAKKIIAMLPPEAQWTFLWSPQGTSQYIEWYYKELMVPTMQGTLPFGELPKYQKSLPVGISGVASENLFETTIVITPDTLHSLILYGMEIQAKIQTIPGVRNTDF